jgi:zinc D-Ala-D-Ala carboxypeptidase
VTLAGAITPGGHFTWAEAVITEQRGLVVRNAETLAANPTAQAAIVTLCETLLEPIRAHFGRPVMVHSLWRCPDLNAVIGGAATSQHVAGERGAACDFHVAGIPLVEVFDWIRLDSGLLYSQCILEGRIPSWIHIATVGPAWTGKRRQNLRWDGISYSAVSGPRL